MPDIKIIHRSFSLAWGKDDLIKMFGSMENAKKEILAHWEHANTTDPLRRFNIEGMRAASFDLPTSKNPLCASKTAGIIEGETAYWDLFDELQKTMFMNSKDISQADIIEECVNNTAIDFDKWKKQFNDPATLDKVKADIDLVKKYGINSVPTLIVNEEHRVSGSLPIEELKNALIRAG